MGLIANLKSRRTTGAQISRECRLERISSEESREVRMTEQRKSRNQLPLASVTHAWPRSHKVIGGMEIEESAPRKLTRWEVDRRRKIIKDRHQPPAHIDSTITSSRTDFKGSAIK